MRQGPTEIEQRVAAAVAVQPLAGNAEIARVTGTTEETACRVRRRLRADAAQTESPATREERERLRNEVHDLALRELLLLLRSGRREQVKLRAIELALRLYPAPTDAASAPDEMTVVHRLRTEVFGQASAPVPAPAAELAAAPADRETAAPATSALPESGGAG